MRKLIPFLLVITLSIGLIGCSSKTNKTPTETNDTSDISSKTEDKSVNDNSIESNSGTNSNTDKKDTLVVVFSATGTTKNVAKKIAEIENADFYEIEPKEEYTTADLNWNDRNSRSTKEQNDPKSRPEIGSEKISVKEYKKIYIGFPIWWGEEPRIVDTFVESYDFSDITVIPFCTSSSSGIGRSGQNLADNAKSGNWLDGKRFSGSVSETELKNWINSL